MRMSEDKMRWKGPVLICGPCTQPGELPWLTFPVLGLGRGVTSGIRATLRPSGESVVWSTRVTNLAGEDSGLAVCSQAQRGRCVLQVGVIVTPHEIEEVHV
jgi:hypothetical protein